MKPPLSAGGEGPGVRFACEGASGVRSACGEASGVRSACGEASAVRSPLSFEEASFVALGGIALEAVRMAHAEIGHRVAVIGLGLLGQLVVQILIASGCRVLGVDLAQDKVDLARRLGADVAINGRETDVPAAVREFTAGYGVDSAIIVASAHDNGPIEQAAEITRERGRVVATGLIGLEIPRKPFYEKELELVVSRAWGPGLYDPNYEERDAYLPLPYVRWTAQRNMATFLELVAGGQVDVKSLITHRFPFDQALDAYNLILEGKEPYIGVILEYDAEPPAPVKRIHINRGKAGQTKAAGQVGIGLIGAGLYARGTLLPALAKVPHVHRAGVATRSGASGRHVAERFGFGYATSDHTELLGDPDIDAIYVLTRHGSHARFVAEALRAGKAVFVEKPLALNEEQLSDVVAAWGEGAGFLMVGFNRRFAPATQFICRQMESLTGPRVVYVRANAGYIPPDSWVHDPHDGGGRIIGEACHFVDLIQTLAGGLPAQVFAAAADAGAGQNLRDNLTATFRLDNGSSATLVYASHGDKSFPREYVEVFGGGAVGVIDNFRSARITAGGRTRRYRAAGVDRGHVAELNAFVDALRSGREQPVAMEEYIAATLATFALEQSITRREAFLVDWHSVVSDSAPKVE